MARIYKAVCQQQLQVSLIFVTGIFVTSNNCIFKIQILSDHWLLLRPASAILQKFAEFGVCGITRSLAQKCTIFHSKRTDFCQLWVISTHAQTVFYCLFKETRVGHGLSKLTDFSNILWVHSRFLRSWRWVRPMHASIVGSPLHRAACSRSSHTLCAVAQL